RPTLNGAGLVADPARGRVIAFGGRAPAGDTNDTWEWDGVEWRLLQPANRPTQRSSPALAVDLATGNVIMHGGRLSSTGTNLHDPWLWNGSDWTSTSPILSPNGDASTTRLEFDRTRNAVVCFTGPFSEASSGFEWTGSDWRRLARATSVWPAAAAEDLLR